MGRPAGEARDTRGAILAAALDAFAEKGCLATSVRDIAAAVGIKDASLYNHFASKQALFQAVVEWQLGRLESMLHADRALFSPADDASAYLDPSGERLLQVVEASYRPFFEDGQLQLLRRLLAIDRYVDERCRALFDRLFVGQPVEIQESIFSQAMARGGFAPGDPALMARQFHGPMFMLLCSDVPWDDARRFLAAHLASFSEAHGRCAPDAARCAPDPC